MARRSDPESCNRVSIHNIGGYRYASTQPAVTDPEIGIRHYHRIHWGTVDDNNKFIPGKSCIVSRLYPKKCKENSLFISCGIPCYWKDADCSGSCYC